MKNMDEITKYLKEMLLHRKRLEELVNIIEEHERNIIFCENKLRELMK